MLGRRCCGWSRRWRRMRRWWRRLDRCRRRRMRWRRRSHETRLRTGSRRLGWRGRGRLYRRRRRTRRRRRWRSGLDIGWCQRAGMWRRRRPGGDRSWRWRAGRRRQRRRLHRRGRRRGWPTWPAGQRRLQCRPTRYPRASAGTRTSASAARRHFRHCGRQRNGGKWSPARAARSCAASGYRSHGDSSRRPDKGRNDGRCRSNRDRQNKAVARRRRRRQDGELARPWRQKE